MHLFYTPVIHSNSVMLSEEESKHAIKVLRLKLGETVILLDGQGGKHKAFIANADPKKCLITITNSELNVGKKSYKVTIAVAPTKNIDRTEWFVEKATEIGIDEIYFITCERSERKTINLDRMEKILVSAMKQSIKAYKPIIHELQSFKLFVQNCIPDSTFIAHLEEHNQVSLTNLTLPATSCILIGPEGDFAPKEIALAYEIGIKLVTLGTSRLRTETAALVACHTVNLLHEMNKH